MKPRCLTLFFTVSLLMLAWTASAVNPNLSGWTYLTNDYGYSTSLGSWLYFDSATPAMSYNFNTGIWTDDVQGWVFVQWPYCYSVDVSAWMFVQPPATGLWYYNYATGEWRVFY